MGLAARNTAKACSCCRTHRTDKRAHVVAMEEVLYEVAERETRI